MNKFKRIQVLQNEIEILESERFACETSEQRKQIDKAIDDLWSIIDCIRESCI